MWSLCEITKPRVGEIIASGIKVGPSNSFSTSVSVPAHTAKKWVGTLHAFLFRYKTNN